MIRIYKTKYCPAWKRYLSLLILLFVILIILYAEIISSAYLKTEYALDKSFDIIFSLILVLSALILAKILTHKSIKKLKRDTSAWVLYNGRIYFIHFNGLPFLNKKIYPIKNYILKVIHDAKAVEEMITGDEPDSRFSVKEITEIESIKCRHFYTKIHIGKDSYIINRSINDYDELIDILKEKNQEVI